MAFDFSKIKGKKIEKDSTKAEALKNVLGGIGVASAGCVDETGIECISHIEYTKGSLKDYLIKTLGDCDDNTI